MGLLTAGVSAAAAHKSAPAPIANEISAVVRNFAGVDDAVLASAENAVNGIYDQIGIHIRWTTHEDLARMLPLDPVSDCTFSSVVLVNLLIRSLELEWPNNVMGATVPAARYIRIAPHRIEERAVEGQVSFGFLLGQVMAHEFGHVFLPNDPHAIEGLMKETLDLRPAQQSPLLILPAQATEMRATIENKLSGCHR